MERAKTRAQLKAIIDGFVSRLQDEIEVERIILWGDYAFGRPFYARDINLLVVSPSFEGLDFDKRIEIVARHGARVEPLIVAWPITPRELARHHSGDDYQLFLAHALAESREVYHGAPAGTGSR